MFDKKTLDQVHQVEEEWQKEYERRYKEESKATTSSNIPLKAIYTPADVQDIDYGQIGMSGLYPYTRGTYPVQYHQPPMSQHGLGFGLPEHTREIYEAYRRAQPPTAEGREPAYFLCSDLPTDNGFDPDEPGVTGWIGTSGVTKSTMRDFEILFDGLPLDKVHTILSNYEGSMAELAMYLVYAERRGYAPEQLRGLNVNCIEHQLMTDHPSASADDTMKLIAEHIRYCARNMPYWTPFRVSGYGWEEAGANPVQELAFSMALTIALVEKCSELGVHPDEFLPRTNVFFGFGNDFFEQIAKCRAWRRMWARIATERFGCQNPRAIRPIIGSQTAGSTFTAQQPLNNVIRAAFQTLAAFLGGANTIWTTPYDEALCIHTEEAANLAFRTEQIILHETNVTGVSDPLGGSYFVEWLTSRMEEEANRLIDQIEGMGFNQAWETGWIRRQIERTAWEHRKKVETGERVIVGVNRYVREREEKVQLRKLDPKVAEVAIQRVKEWRARRDSNRTLGALGRLREVATSVKEKWPRGGDLMPALMDAFRADATLGETVGVVKEVFGFDRRFY